MDDDELVPESEIGELISKCAEKYDVPEEVLLEIYSEEQAVVGMERRGSIFKDVDKILQNYVDNRFDE